MPSRPNTAKQTEYRSKLEQLQKADESYYIDAIAILNIASRSKELFIGSELDQKREIIKLVFQNLSFDGQKVQYSLQKPFDSIFIAHNHSAWGGQRELNP
ncbi:MAG: hypothetical protein HYV32_03460 [Candidatus Kerfeldbacteria bacterium]|nr:hypothetical protein [Candidatus Kerfeldbacteria bacterium]